MTRIHPPEIDRPDTVWFNTGRPLSLAALRGKFVILDFWTSCCVNCLHVLETLRHVEEAFPDTVVVIGVHSPKFPAERDAANVAKAIARYDIRHPVVHDASMRIWRDYAIRAWPTLVFIGPDGNILGQTAGEPDRDKLLIAVRQIVAESEKQGFIKATPLDLQRLPSDSGRLAFPGKLRRLADPGPPRWAVADAGHHQIVILDDAGNEIERFGSGRFGREDGPADQADFASPQGIAAAPGHMYVADTANHAIRHIDLGKRRIATLAGTGRRGGALGDPRPGASTALASVWDLALVGNRLYFANAGTHQIGIVDLGRRTVAAAAGTGGESISDGPAQSALLAQPSGLAVHPDRSRIAFADSESSSVRLLHLGFDNRIETLVGTGLFDFGHVNGPFGSARLQHALGLDWLDSGRLVVADSYNNALRVIDLETRAVRDLDDGLECRDAVCRPLAEPAGVTVAGPERLLVSDTNNHRILEYDLADRYYRTWCA